MKILTVLGTRPEIIRLGPTIECLDRDGDHVLVHTGQNQDPGLSEIFFAELGVRRPDHQLTLRAGSLGARLAQLMVSIEQALLGERPDRMLVLGDTDSGLAAAVLAKRLGAKLFHMEAGNRCFDDRVPEELNRRLIDHASDVLLPYTEGSRHKLLREGIDPGRVLVTGNPIGEVLGRHRDAIEDASAGVLARLGVEPGNICA